MERPVPYGDQMFEVPNLDDFSTNPRDFIEAARVLKILAQYCENKSFSIEARLTGRLDLAERNERANENRFNALPQWAKW